MDKRTISKIVKQHQEFVERATKPVPPAPPRTTYLLEDPMSPYKIIESKMAFQDVADEVNTRSFKAVYPQSYTPVHRYFTENKIDPYFSPGEDADYAHGAITIAGMIDLVYMRAPWALVNVEDFDTILDIAQRYYQVLCSSHDNRRVAEYKQRVEKFLVVMEKGRLRAYRRVGKIDILKSKDLKYILKEFVD